MEQVTIELREKPVVDKVDSLTKQMAKNWVVAKKSKNVWDFKNFEKARLAYGEGVDELLLQWPDYEKALAGDVETDRAYVQSAEYQQAVSEALQGEGIPLQGDFPQYEFPPFKLVIGVADMEVKLSMGKKQEKTTMMHPKPLAAWVGRHYQAVVGKKLDVTTLMRDLLNAYKFANKAAYREGDVLWGRAVGLDVIYDLLTLKKSFRQEYPKPLFVFQLGQLKEQFDLTLDEYRFELGYARNQEKAMVLVDSKGRESRMSSLTIHKVEE